MWKIVPEVAFFLGELDNLLRLDKLALTVYEKKIGEISHFSILDFKPLNLGSTFFNPLCPSPPNASLPNSVQSP